MNYNKSFFANRIVDTWLIYSETKKRHKVELADNGTYFCSCFAKNECFGIKQAKAWQEAEKKGYQY